MTKRRCCSRGSTLWEPGRGTISSRKVKSGAGGEPVGNLVLGIQAQGEGQAGLRWLWRMRSLCIEPSAVLLGAQVVMLVWRAGVCSHDGLTSRLCCPATWIATPVLDCLQGSARQNTAALLRSSLPCLAPLAFAVQPASPVDYIAEHLI